MNAKRTLLTTGLLAIVCCSTGCESLSSTAAGGLVGGGVGAGPRREASPAGGTGCTGVLLGERSAPLAPS